VPEDHVVLCDEAIFPAIPLGLDIEVASQIREAPAFHKEPRVTGQLPLTDSDLFAWHAVARSGTGLNKYSHLDRVSRL
jgi:hypothetical protein